jgi:hypothetical protein
MPAFIDLTGQTFGRLTVVRFLEMRRQSYWLCQCVCGNQSEAAVGSLRSGAVRSCGCLRVDTVRARELKHGMAHEPEYAVWGSMKARCHRPRDAGFAKYGDRGIVVCERWRSSFENFIADMGRRPSDDHSIERINNDGNYEPSNCRWATKSEQMSNRRGWGSVSQVEIRGVRKTTAAWARELGTSQTTIDCRIKRGWSPERAVTQPVRRKATP